MNTRYHTTQSIDGFVDELRPHIGGYPVFIQRGMGYDEAVIIDRAQLGQPAEPAVIVNGPVYLMLTHPTLDVWAALDMWIREKVIEPAYQAALAAVAHNENAEAMRHTDLIVTRDLRRRLDALKASRS